MNFLQLRAEEMAAKDPEIGQVSDVANAVRMASADDGKGLGRVVFFIGAGCSISAGIPLVRDMARTLVRRLAVKSNAPEIIVKDASEAYRWLAGKKQIRDCFRQILKEPPPDSVPEIDWFRVYDAAFSDHFNTPDDARELFSEFVDAAGGKINWAHLCLGELVRKRLVSTVLTTNFDQLVLAGLVRSGVLPVVCDGIESLTRVRGAPLHPQIVELHGSRHTYRLRNSPEEVAELANDESTIAAIGSLFQDLRAFVAVGYGGREDGIMDLLIKSAQRYRDKRLFWICHDANPATLSPKVREFLSTSRNSRLLVGRDADSFFVRLLQTLEIGAPEAIREPLFLAGLHADSLAAPDEKVADSVIVASEIARLQEEIRMLGGALAHHRDTRGRKSDAMVRARELQLAGNNQNALEVLLRLPEHLRDLEVWSAIGEMAFRDGEVSAHNESLELAVTAWRQALNAGSQHDNKDSANSKFGLALSLQTLGERKGDDAALLNAIEIYRSLLAADYARNQNPLEWARTQNNLGGALVELGERESGTARLEEAVAAFRAALEEQTRERVPLDWALTQNNLGGALRTLGERESGPARLEEAVVACRAALEERTRERVPFDWAATQNNLGNALSRLGDHESGTARLEEAVIAYRAALEELSREQVPLYWAAMQNNLGFALARLGEREGNAGRLEEAVVTCRNALEQRKRGQVPLDWALTQSNLGFALSRLGGLEEGTARLEEAVVACRAALEVQTRERTPLDWALTQSYLGAALRMLGEREGDTALLEQAVAACHAALEEQTRERVPLEWAWTQRNLGAALRMLGEREGNMARLEQAVAAYRAALEGYRRDQAPWHWKKTQANLDKTLELLRPRKAEADG
jgi:tetratricopeptide (TPR) repeat protein/NAD-dependent SIR2 family protein deacetylase